MLTANTELTKVNFTQVELNFLSDALLTETQGLTGTHLYSGVFSCCRLVQFAAVETFTVQKTLTLL